LHGTKTVTHYDTKTYVKHKLSTKSTAPTLNNWLFSEAVTSEPKYDTVKISCT